MDYMYFPNKLRATVRLRLFSQSCSIASQPSRLVMYMSEDTRNEKKRLDIYSFIGRIAPIVSVFDEVTART